MSPRPGHWGSLVVGFSGPHLPAGSRCQPAGAARSFAIHYILSGQSWYLTSPHRKQHVAAGDFFVNIPGQFASPTIPNASKDFLQAVIIIDRETYLLCQKAGAIGILPIFGTLGVLSHLVLAFDRLVKRIWDITFASASGGDSALTSALSLIADLRETHATSNHASNANSPVQQAATRLGQQCLDRTPIPDIAREAGVSYESFRKRFREQIGTSPQEYRLRHRMEAATKLLCEGWAAHEVADHLGYSDPFTFSKAFKRHMGLSPSDICHSK